MGTLTKWKELYKEGLLLNYFYRQLTLKRIVIIPFYLEHEGLGKNETNPVTPKLTSCETVLLKPVDMRIIAAYKERDQSEEEMLAMLEDGCQCIGIKYNDEIVAYGWYSLKDCNSPYIRFPLEDNEAYLFGARTLSKYRGNNLAPFLRYQMYLHLKSLGRHTIFSLSNYSNLSSIRFKKKLGAYHLKLYVFLRLTKSYKRSLLVKTYNVSEKNRFLIRYQL